MVALALGSGRGMYSVLCSHYVLLGWPGNKMPIDEHKMDVDEGENGSGAEEDPPRRQTRSTGGKAPPSSATKATPGKGKGTEAEKAKALAAEKAKAKAIVMGKTGVKGTGSTKAAPKPAGEGAMDVATEKLVAKEDGSTPSSTGTSQGGDSLGSDESSFPAKMLEAAKLVVSEVKSMLGAKQDAASWYLSSPDYTVEAVNPWNTKNALSTEWRLERSKLLFDGVMEELQKLQPLLIVQTQGRLSAEARLEQSAVDLTGHLKEAQERAQTAEARAKKMSEEAAANERQRRALDKVARGRYEAKCKKIAKAAIEAAYYVGGAHCVRSIAFRHVRGDLAGDDVGPLEEADRELVTRLLYDGSEEEFEQEEAEWVESYPQYAPEKPQAKAPPAKKARTAGGKFKAAEPEPEKTEEEDAPRSIVETIEEAAAVALAEQSVIIKNQSTVVRLNALTQQYLTSLEVVADARRGDLDFGALLTGLLSHHIGGQEGDFPCGLPLGGRMEDEDEE
jgi:hypothetical protein